jgi:hypothetical protein
MPALRNLTVVGLALLLAAACDTAPQPTAPTDTPPEPAFNFTNGPDNPSPVVLRVDGAGLGVFFFDPDRELISVHGIDPDNFFLCGGTGGFGEADLQSVDTPDEAAGLTTLLRSREALVTVFEGDNPQSLAEFCALLAGPTRVALGGEDVKLTARQGTNILSFTWRFVGILEDAADGSPIHYTEVQKFTSGQGFVVEDIFLRPISGP